MRYSIAFALFACLCVAGGIAGYRVGFDSGYASGKAKRESEQPYPKVYPVGEIIRATHQNPATITGPLEFQFLIDSAQTMVFPGEWEALGGPCSMAPIPWLEALAVNATSGVHDRLSEFFSDLAGLKEAVARSQLKQREMQQRQREWIANMLEPVSNSLGKELKPIEASTDLIGKWIVESASGDSSPRRYLYSFSELGTVSIAPVLDPDQSSETWYSAGLGTIVISGLPYIAASTPERTIVLAPTKDPEAILVATRIDNAPEPITED